MPAERLYYQDQYIRRFTSRVVSCRRGKDGWIVTLEGTAFYPEGGGQPGDRGVLGGAAVADTRELDGEVVHLCTSPLAPGEEVCGEIDWPRRFDFMQQHSGEHIVSGLIHARFGCDNTGFHLGAETTAIDFDAPLTWDQLMDIEREANEKIWACLPVEAGWPDAAELAALDYRSKKELHGPVRIVSVPGTDVCACCGVHVAHTGEIGLIKIVSAQKLRGGVRAVLLCGRRAYEHMRLIFAQNRQISAILSAPPEDTYEAVRRVRAELEGARYRLYGCEEQLFRQKAKELAGSGDALVFYDGLDGDGLRRLAAAVSETCSGRVAVFSGSDGDGWRYVLAQRDGDVRDLVKKLNAALNGRGGGKPSFAQGSVQAPRTEIETFFLSCFS